MNISLVNLAAYEMPKAIEDKRKDWVAYGEDNDYYNHLVNAYLTSATNNAAIRSIADLVYGGGICIEDLEKYSNEVKELRKVI